MLRKIFAFLFLVTPTLLFASRWSDRAFYIIETGTSKEIRRAIETDYSFVKYTRGKEKENLLMAALKSEREKDVIDVLLKAGISPTSKDKNKKTALMYACEHESNIDAIKAVLDFNAPFKYQKARRILATDKSGNNCFDYARMNGCRDDVIKLLSQYAEDFKTTEAVSEAPEIVPEPEIPAEPLEPVVPPEAEETATEIPAEEAEPPAAEEEKPEEPQEPPVEEEVSVQEIEEDIEELEMEDFDVDFPKRDMLELNKMVGPGVFTDSIYLYDYAKNEPEDNLIPKELIKDPGVKFTYIENAGSKNSKGVTLLMEAAKAGNVKSINDLILSGAKVDDTDNEGWTALMFAVRFQKNPEVAQTLIKYGASPVLNNKYGINSLKLAAGYSNSKDVIATLLKPFKAESEEVRSAFVYGIKNSNKAENLQAFIDKKVQLNVAYKGKSYLMYACESNRKTDIIEMLLKAGASKYQVEETTGKTAFDYARENDRLKHDSVYWSLNTK